MLTSLNWQKMTIICTVEELSSCTCNYLRCTWCSQTFITGKCLWNGRALINLFLCMQSWNAAFFIFFFVGYSLGDLGSGSGSKFNRAARVGSGWVRQSRVRAGFGLQFWARADLWCMLMKQPIKCFSVLKSSTMSIVLNIYIYIMFLPDSWIRGEYAVNI